MAFVDRIDELAFFNSLLTARQPTPARLVLLYGRRRVGKTELLRHWFENVPIPSTYIAFERDPAVIQRKKLAAQVKNTTVDQVPSFDTWQQFWSWLAAEWRNDPHILIVDEVTYASDADEAMLSSLQSAWDQTFKQSRAIICLCGSHVQSLEKLMHHGSPLFGRFTNVWYLQPFEYGVLQQVFPKWSVEERVAAYAIVGGVPAYLEWLDPSQSLVENIRKVILNPGGMFLTEPIFLLYDELERIQTYHAIVRAIGIGMHTLDEISNETLVAKTNLTEYLQRLQEIRLIERRQPVTLPERKLRTARRGRYHLTDPFFRFYFAFLRPRQGELPDPEAILTRVKTQLRGFVGGSAFEEIARRWVQQAARTGRLPFVPEAIGAHWSRYVQVDVVAINRAEHRLLLGECKWTDDPISLATVRELIEDKLPKVLADMAGDDTAKRGAEHVAAYGAQWTVSIAFFSRRGFTPEARARIHKEGGLAIDLAQLDADLKR